MTEDDKRAMQAAWYEWHAGVSLHVMPAVNASFGRGFEAGMAHAMGASHAVIARLRGENAVLADILRDADKVIAAIESGDVTTYSLHELGMAISHALEPYEAKGDLLI